MIREEEVSEEKEEGISQHEGKYHFLNSALNQKDTVGPVNMQKNVCVGVGDI